MVILRADKPVPEIIALEELKNMWSGTAILISKKVGKQGRLCLALDGLYLPLLNIKESLY